LVRLPKPGGDAGNWGDVLNEFLAVSHDQKGALTTAAVVDAGAVIKNELVFNVHDFGAKGDGITDNAPAFQAAINACAQVNGGTVFIPPASQPYVIGRSLEISQPMAIAGCNWESTVLRLKPGVDDFMFTFTQTAHNVMFGAIFRNLKLELDAPNQAAGGGISAISALH
jgi:hypothetical protein